MKHLFILSQPRSGLHLIRECLSQHNNIFIHKKELICPSYRCNRLNQTADEILSHLENLIQEDTRYVGFGAQIEHIKYKPDLMEHLVGAKIIIIYRRKRLERFVSYKIAMKRGRWHNPSKNLPTVDINLGEFISVEERHKREYYNLLEYLNSRVADYLIIEYEDILDSIIRIYKWLRLRPIETNMAELKGKTEYRQMSESINNYDEIIHKLHKIDYPLEFIL